MYKVYVNVPNVSDEVIYGNTLLEVKEKVGKKLDTWKNIWVNVLYECDDEYLDSEEVFIDKDGTILY